MALRSRGRGDRLKYRVIYYIVYVVLISYPLYRILLYTGSLSTPFNIMVYTSLTLIAVGIYRSVPEAIILGYILSGLVYQIHKVPGAPSLYEILLYSLIVLHGEILSRLTAIGIGVRRIRASLVGAAVSAILIAGLLFIYLTVSYVLAGLFINLALVSGNASLLAKLVIGSILKTRVGSILLFSLVALSVYYVLNNYINALLSDTILLTKGYVYDKVKSYFNELHRRLLRNNLWHQKLFVRTYMFIILFFTWAFTSPVFTAVLSMAGLDKVPGSTYLSYLLAIAVGILVYGLVNRGLYRLVKFQFFAQQDIRLRVPRPGVSIAPLAISLILLATYILLLGILYPTRLTHTLLTVVGLDTPFYDNELMDRYVGPVTIGFTSFTRELPFYLEQYINYVVMEFEWLVRIVKTIINVLWG